MSDFYSYKTGDTRYSRGPLTATITASMVATLTAFSVTACNGALLHSVAITASGLPTTTASIAYTLQGTLDNTNWFTVANSTINTNTTFFASSADAFKSVRNVINANTAGGVLVINNLGAN